MLNVHGYNITCDNCGNPAGWPIVEHRTDKGKLDLVIEALLVVRRVKTGHTSSFCVTCTEKALGGPRPPTPLPMEDLP